MEIAKNIFYLGANDRKINLFEGQYNVPNGMSYNSYLIKDEKNVILDTIDKAVTEEWFKKLDKALNGENVDYLVISHMEPDHAFNIGVLANKYPEMKIVGNINTFNMLPRFFNINNLDSRKVLVKEGETLQIGKHCLQFFMAPMVHWPEVMVTYEQSEKILFTADAFGKFGIIKENDNWVDEARRYYFGIVGQYGMQVQNLLKKANTLDIKTICPLHGPILRNDIEYYIDKYDKWSKYEPEEDGVLIVCSSIYGNTLEATKYLESILKENQKNVRLVDLTKEDMAEAVSVAFKYNKLVLASSTYNAGIFPPMECFLNKIKIRNFQKRKVAIIENGTWAPSSGRAMKSLLQEMKEIDIIEPIITIKSTLQEDTKQVLKELVNKM